MRLTVSFSIKSDLRLHHCRVATYKPYGYCLYKYVLLQWLNMIITTHLAVVQDCQKRVVEDKTPHTTPFPPPSHVNTQSPVSTLSARFSARSQVCTSLSLSLLLCALDAFHFLDLQLGSQSCSRVWAFSWFLFFADFSSFTLHFRFYTGRISDSTISEFEHLGFLSSEFGHFWVLCWYVFVFCLIFFWL